MAGRRQILQCEVVEQRQSKRGPRARAPGSRLPQRSSARCHCCRRCQAGPTAAARAPPSLAVQPGTRGCRVPGTHLLTALGVADPDGRNPTAWLPTHRGWRSGCCDRSRRRAGKAPVMASVPGPVVQRSPSSTLSGVPSTINPCGSLPPTHGCHGQILLPPCCHKDQDPTAIRSDRAPDLRLLVAGAGFEPATSGL